MGRKEKIPIHQDIEFRLITFNQVDYYCPEEFIDIWRAEILHGKTKKYKPYNKEGFCCAHWFYFCVLKTGQYSMVSGLSFEAFLKKEMLESRLSNINHRPKITPLATDCLVDMFKNEQTLLNSDKNDERSVATEA